MSGRNLFTPKFGDERLTLYISNNDKARIGRGSPWKAIIKDVDTGDKYACKGMACSIPTCFCDAMALRKVEP